MRNGSLHRVKADPFDLVTRPVPFLGQGGKWILKTEPPLSLAVVSFSQPLCRGGFIVCGVSNSDCWYISQSQVFVNHLNLKVIYILSINLNMQAHFLFFIRCMPKYLHLLNVPLIGCESEGLKLHVRIREITRSLFSIRAMAIIFFPCYPYLAHWTWNWGRS